ncbi:MAG: hypothetical protein AB1705_03040 [Verrucomicrobiota bacterium]
MDAKDDYPLDTRPPTKDDLLLMCRSLNELGAKYLIVGGFAVIEHGFTRATEDIDVLLEASRENQLKVRKALEVLPDKAVRELEDDDLEEYLVVRIADEFVVDLMLKTCGITYVESQPEIEVRDIEGVPIPFASAGLLLKMKQTYREKDALDRQFLEEKLRKKR